MQRTSGIEVVLTALLDRFAREHGVAHSIRSYSVRGGHGRAIFELKQYLRDLRCDRKSLPDLLVVGRDANCKGISECRQEIENLVADFAAPILSAIPEPHVERWLLLDSAAFKKVLGKGCNAPNQKCEKGRYKNLLVQAVHGTGIMPLIGGMEHAEALVNAMDLHRMERADESVGRFLKSLHTTLSEWTRT